MVIAVIGAQWGDEGKGKIVDLLAERFDIVVRYQGGHNAGHSVQIEDKAGRRGIRVADALVPDVLRSRIERNLEDANRIIVAYGGEPLDADTMVMETAFLVERLAPFITDTSHFLNQAAASGKTILLEGAQATLLDVDHGTYPFVTSSSTVVGGALVGTGLAPKHLAGVLGIVRTYTTRVGEGPFPTEMLESEAELGQLIREPRREYGASTGRPRRCGWFDAFATRYAAEINGFTSVALTKLDVLDALDEIKVCVGYNLDGKRCDSLPSVSQDLRRVDPFYETLPGWKSSTVGTTDLNELPVAAREYVNFLSSRIGVQIGLVSTGPERSQTIIVRDSALAEWIR